MIARWTRGALRLRRPILAGWALVAAAGLAASVQLPSLLSLSLSVPGSSSNEASALLARHFHVDPDGTFTVVFATTRSSDAELSQLTARVTKAAAVVPTARVEPLSVANGIVYGSVATSLDLARAATYTGALRRALAASPGPVAEVTGEPAIQYDLTALLAADLHRGELLALPLALLVLALVFGVGWALLLPFVFALCTIAASLGVIDLLAHVVTMASYVPNLVELVGLGLAIDYSLLTVHRFREELARVGEPEAAVVATMETAGRSVLFSGAAVALGLAMTLLIPVPFIRSVGVAGLLVPLFSLLAAVTLQPVLLGLLGAGASRHRTALASSPPGSTLVPGRFERAARVLLAHRVAALVGAGLVLGAAIAPVAALQLTPGSVFAVPHFTPSARGEALLLRSVGAGAMTPIYLVVDAGSAGRVASPAVQAALERLMAEAGNEPQVFLIEYGTRYPYLDATGRYERLEISARQEFGSEATQHLVSVLRSRLIPEARFPAGVTVYTGGAPAEGVDFLGRVYAVFPFVVGAMLVAAFLLLLRAFRSLLLAAMAVLLDLVSVGAAYGLLVVTFRFGAGADLLGLYRVGQIEGWIPVLLFAVLFGLSMDYEVFLVTRMREARDLGATTTDAIATGVGRTGEVVTAAAAVMVVTFAGFVAGHVADLQEFGVGLGLGVLLDATVVRLVVLPCLVSLLGERAWWLPGGHRRPDAPGPPPGTGGAERGPEGVAQIS